MAREIGPRLHMAFRRTRAALWRFKRSPARQDRAAMYATFAFIGAFAIGSVDAIITGGADFGPHSAYAAEYQAVRVTPPAAVTPAPAVEAVVEEEAVKTAAAAEIDYSFTTEVLLGGPELELAVSTEPLLQDVLAEGGKVEQPEPVAATEAELTVF